jgi:hypothetical protein
MTYQLRIIVDATQAIDVTRNGGGRFWRMQTNQRAYAGWSRIEKIPLGGTASG